MAAFVAALPALTIFVSLLALTVVVAQLVTHLLAERAWVKAVHTRAELLDVLRDLTSEERLRGGTAAAQLRWQRDYMPTVLEDMLTRLEADRTISEKDAELIRAALKQPSTDGRRSYARKLVREGLEQHVMA